MVFLDICIYNLSFFYQNSRNVRRESPIDHLRKANGILIFNQFPRVDIAKKIDLYCELHSVISFFTRANPSTNQGLTYSQTLEILRILL